MAHKLRVKSTIFLGVGFGNQYLGYWLFQIKYEQTADNNDERPNKYS